jgi:hypothetical protein
VSRKGCDAANLLFIPIPAHLQRSVILVRRVCELAGSLTFLEEIRSELRDAGLQQAVNRRDTPRIFDWLLTSFSYQGVSDQVARSYIRKHGSARWTDIEARLARKASCPRLRGYHHYDGCRYDKTSATCAEPDHIAGCPVPSHRLRNGRLNQTAYSFYLFVRDIAKGDLVAWIDERLAAVETPPLELANSACWQDRLVGLLRNVYGISDKILCMTLSDLLIGASDGRPQWLQTGTAMIAIDTLVHNFLHRTGILHECGRLHGYGVGCYAPGGCADLLRTVAALIDARHFNRHFPAIFPRFIQHALWRFCAADGLNLCNGNRIDDRNACQISYCQLLPLCGRKVLKT